MRWAGFVQPSLKLDPTLWTASRESSAAKQDDGRYELMIEGFAGASAKQISETIQKQVPGVTITQTSIRAEAAPYVRLAEWWGTASFPSTDSSAFARWRALSRVHDHVALVMVERHAGEQVQR